MINTSCLSLLVQLPNNGVNKNTCFKILQIRDKFYAANFDNETQWEVVLKGVDEDILFELNNLGDVNYAFFEYVNKQKNEGIIAVYKASNILRINELNIFSNLELLPPLRIYDSNDEQAIILYNNIHDDTKNSFLVESIETGKFYTIVKDMDFDEKNQDALLYYYGVKGQLRGLKNQSDYQKIVFHGSIQNVNKKRYLSLEDRIALDKVKKDVQNYLNLWDQYNEIEFNMNYQMVKDMGYVKYQYMNRDHGIKLYFSNENFEKIKNIYCNNMIMIGTSLLKTLFDTKDLEEFNKVEKELLSDNAITIGSIEGEPNVIEKSIKIKVTDDSFFEDHNGSGFIALSLLGDKISFSRRQNAKEKILTGQAGISKLYELFSDNPMPLAKAHGIFSIDYSLIKEKRLTTNQEEAISIICNTPDIAIIQGPPGTGKTTVISEALRQLNAKKDSKYELGNNLVSGFKQETVNNLIDKVKLFDIPSIKVGKSDDTVVESQIYQFVDELTNKLNEKYSDLNVDNEDYVQFKKKYYTYVNFNNSIESSIAILNDVKNLDKFKNDVEVCANIDKFISKLKPETSASSFEELNFMRFLYTLPLSEKAYLDNKNGVDIDIMIFEEIPEYNKAMGMLKDFYNDRDYVKIKALRRELIMKYRKTPEFLVSKKLKQNIIEYLNKLLSEIQIDRIKKFDGDKLAILDYIDSLNENPKLIRDTLLNYTKVLAATNQQSLSKEMFKVKGKEVFFDSVIIDEAATSSPLDLFIPMSLAQERVVLVGDHKQLPNIVNESILNEVADHVSGDKSIDVSKIMKTTLFEILMEKAKSLQKQDGIKRVITLNAQFRMHPKLGEIVNNYFYKDETPLLSPLDEKHFEHNYHCLKNKYLYWLDAPYDDTKAYRIKGSSSRINKVEARIIAHHIKDALDADDFENLSIGVITIYRDQVQEIMKALIEVKVFNKDAELEDKYSNRNIFVNTVDAFQGKEFDIVYLSLAYDVKDIAKEKHPYSRYTMENCNSLMCVAMSRQKKMIIMVGDLDLYSNELCKVHVPLLYDLAQRCKQENLHELYYIQ